MTLSLFKDGSHQINKSQLARYASVFGALFTDFYILSGTTQVPVPIKFGNGNVRNKAETQLDSDTSGKPRVKPALPAMSFTFGSIVKDGQRQTVDHATLKSKNIYFKTNTAHSKSSMSPSPYNIDFILSVRTNNTTEALLIFEQIESAFAKGVNVRMVDSDLLDVERVINIRKQPSLDINDNFENMDETRYVEFDLAFTLKGFLYNRISDVPVILEMNTSLNNGSWITDTADPEEVEILSLKQTLGE